eukprot:gene15011-815_t
MFWVLPQRPASVPRNAMDGSVPEMVHGGKVPGGLTCTCADSRDCPMGAARE